MESKTREEFKQAEEYFAQQMTEANDKFQAEVAKLQVILHDRWLIEAESGSGYERQRDGNFSSESQTPDGKLPSLPFAVPKLMQ